MDLIGGIILAIAILLFSFSETPSSLKQEETCIECQMSDEQHQEIVDEIKKCRE